VPRWKNERGRSHLLTEGVIPWYLTTAIQSWMPMLLMTLVQVSMSRREVLAEVT
jgi:hypothetical protein